MKIKPINPQEPTAHIGIIATIKMWFVLRKFKKIRKQADLLREQSGQQQFVVMLNGGVKIISRNWFKYNRQHGAWRDKTIADLKQECLYYTKR